MKQQTRGPDLNIPTSKADPRYAQTLAAAAGYFSGSVDWPEDDGALADLVWDTARGTWLTVKAAEEGLKDLQAAFDEGWSSPVFGISSPVWQTVRSLLMGLKLTPLMTRSLIGRRAEISSEDAWDTSKEAILLNLATKFAALSEVIEPFSMCLTDPETGVADNPVLGLVAQQVLEHLLRAHEELGYFGRIVYNMPWKTASPEGDAANKNVNRFEQSQGDPVQSAVTAVSALPTPSLADTVQQRRGELLTAIAEKTTEIEEAEIALHGLVGEARTLKVPWREIGAVVGVTPQAAMRRFDETAREKHNEYQRQARARS